jgi:DNA repair protein RadC
MRSENNSATFYDTLLKILSDGMRDKSAEERSALARSITERFGSLVVVASLSYAELSDLVGEHAAIEIKLYAAIASRRATDGFRYGIKHSHSEILDHIIASFVACSREQYYVMSFDKAGRVIAFDFMAEGSINALEVSARIVTECAIKRRAASVIIAHNHPLGSPIPSEADMNTTTYLAAALLASGVGTLASVIVAERSAGEIALAEDYFDTGMVSIEYHEYGKEGAVLLDGLGK